MGISARAAARIRSADLEMEQGQEASVESEGAPKELFISYGREPQLLQFVSRLRRDLESNGFTVWLDLQVRGVQLN